MSQWRDGHSDTSQGEYAGGGPRGQFRPRFMRAVAGWLVMQLYGGFEPTQFVADIAPRPLVMVNGLDDPQMPAEAVIWMRTGICCRRTPI